MVADDRRQAKRNGWPWVRSLWWLCALAFPLLTGFGPPRVVDSAYTPSHTVQIGEVERWQVTEPDLGATAYLLYDMDTDQILFSANAERALPPASLTKLMTSLLVLEAGNLQDQVTIFGMDLVGGASMGLAAGEVLTVEELLWGLLIPSGNDAAAALARHTAGTVDGFVDQMNTKATALGLTATHFVNPHGLDAPGHVSSAADMLTLARRNWEYPLFREIVGTASTIVRGHALQTTNELLDTYPGTIGIKTGTTDAAGQCLVAGFVKDNHEVITVVLGSADRFSDTRTLYAQYQVEYQWLTGSGQVGSALNQLQGPDGRTWYLRTTETPPSFFVRTTETGQLRAFRRLALPADEPWQAGMQVGVMEWRLNDRVVASQPLVLW